MIQPKIDGRQYQTNQRLPAAVWISIIFFNNYFENWFFKWILNVIGNKWLAYFIGCYRKYDEQ